MSAEVWQQETCSQCGRTGKRMQDWCPPDYPSVGEMCQPCYIKRYPTEWSAQRIRELEDERAEILTQFPELLRPIDHARERAQAERRLRMIAMLLGEDA